MRPTDGDCPRSDRGNLLNVRPFRSTPCGKKSCYNSSHACDPCLRGHRVQGPPRRGAAPDARARPGPFHRDLSRHARGHPQQRRGARLPRRQRSLLAHRLRGARGRGRARNRGRQAVHALRAAARPRARDLEWAPRRRGGRGPQLRRRPGLRDSRAGGGAARLVGCCRTLFYRLGGDDPDSTRAPRGCCTRCGRAPAPGECAAAHEDPGQIVHELRLDKEPRELESMRLAIAQTRRGTWPA